MNRQLLIAGLAITGTLACSHRTFTGTDFAPEARAQAPVVQAPVVQASLAYAQMLRSQQLWLQGALRNYDYATTVLCYCTEDYIRAMRVNVREGRVASAQYLDDGMRVPEKIVQSLRTIEQWFAYIDKGLRKPYFLLDVEYHAQLGYPVRLQADVRQQVADDERTVRIWNLVPDASNY